jgi:hypothetical protein
LQSQAGWHTFFDRVVAAEEGEAEEFVSEGYFGKTRSQGSKLSLHVVNETWIAFASACGFAVDSVAAAATPVGAASVAVGVGVVAVVATDDAVAAVVVAVVAVVVAVVAVAAGVAAAVDENIVAALE